jgi:hypothetical protein
MWAYKDAVFHLSSLERTLGFRRSSVLQILTSFNAPVKMVAVKMGASLRLSAAKNEVKPGRLFPLPPFA